MSAPEQVRLKRKRAEEPPQILLLTRAQDAADDYSRKRIRYELQPTEATKKTATPSLQSAGKSTTSEVTRNISASIDDTSAETSVSRPSAEPVISRKFHLKRARGHSIDESSAKRSRDATYNVPVFEEDFFRTAKTANDEDQTSASTADASPYRTKRPGRGAAIRNTQLTQHGTSRTNAEMQELADSMHQFALDELSKIPKPTTKTKPRMSSAQSKSRHERIVASASASPASMDTTDAMDIDDSDFVFDTYVLTEGAEITDDLKGDIGLLVIHEDDEEYWNSLLDDLEQTEDVDEEDENAEDHYAADYPEDELASDDEYDDNAYSFRPRANSDLEQWDHREDSDDVSEPDPDPYSMQSQTVKRWEQELGIPPSHSKN